MHQPHRNPDPGPGPGLGPDLARLRADAARQTRRWARLGAWDAWFALLVIGLPIVGFLVFVGLVIAVLAD